MSQLNSTDNIRLIQLFEHSVDTFPNNTALICNNVSLSYQELEFRTNQLANYLISLGIKEQHSVAILLDRSLESYLSILAVLKTGATYVPIETEYPDERVNYILADMPFHSVITSSSQFTRQTAIKFPNVVILDVVKDTIAQHSTERPSLTAIEPDQLCYVIYTSGSTGKPKGVEITHRNICHYVSVASQLYQMTPNDRVYQGFSLAFDASLEELWITFANGGTLITCISKDIRSGIGLIDFLNEQKVTVLSTVPTLLSTLYGDLPHLRLLILGGEACSSNLVSRWSRADLRIINTYGPTEATIIATYTECSLDKPITIGKPLPGYEVVIIDENLEEVPDGQQGELCIAGAGLARGYVNRPDLTSLKFINNATNPSQRLYRTGDLAMINTNRDIEFLGRIDDQIKLRGFRIELNEIETVMMGYSSVNQAVVALQNLEQPILVAYLHVNDNFNLQEFKIFLQQRLPHYMLPAAFELVDSFPLLASGKVNRKALPAPNKIAQTPHHVAPKTALEQQIATVWAEHLKQQAISIEDDFFYDLGGHSLSAAVIVSNLRKIPVMQSLSMLDLYQNPTIKQLAEKFNKAEPDIKVNEAHAKKNRTTTSHYYLCGIGQFFGCLLQYALRSWQLLAVILCYTWIVSNNTSFSKEAFFILLSLFVAMPIVSLAVTVCAKWILVGRVKPGVYKLWGWFYLRWWLTKRLEENIFSPQHLVGTPLLALYYRLLGAKIGKNCYIGTENIAIHDLITIGDNSSIGFDARLLGYVVEDGWLKIGAITIGENCFVGSRSVISINTTMSDNAHLDDMSMLPIGAHIPAHQFFSGSPACQTTAAPEHITNLSKNNSSPGRAKSIYYGALHYLCMVFVMVVYYLCYFPALWLISYFHEQTHYLFTLTLVAPIGAIIFLGLYYLGIGACKKILMNKITPGIYSLHSLYYLRQWTIVKLLDTVEVNVMADTLYFPYLLRFLGAKLGKRVEMGETPHLIPDLITIGDEGFTASAVALAWPSVHQGSIRYAPIQIGKRGFVGNDSLLPLGANVGEEGLLGCMSITPPNNQAAHHHTAWLGSPAVFLPRREEFSGYSDQEKFTPPKRLIKLRLAVEFAKIILPTTFTLVGLLNMLYGFKILSNNYSLTTTFCLFPIVEILVTMSLVSIVVMLKWLILGRLKPTSKPIWNAFIWKNDVIKYLHTYYIDPNFVDIILGTPFVATLFRCFGAKIGKRVFIDSSDFGECDLITIGDDVCINYQAVIQTHLYEDRIFKMSTININSGCNIGVASIVLYSTVMEKNSTLGDFSLLMKGERLLEHTNWQGIPAQHMSAHTHQQPRPEQLESPDDALVSDVPESIF
ncbi:MAG: amino acid adenylation domain-containing protein [Legionellaceae bacterium]|nr:amino acid adenylation domain-containing protein [Legionellaceae bacterium]